jgi:coniferyl-aldehyde dehydrogenase
MSQIGTDMMEALERQRRAFIAGGLPSANLRRDRLQRAISMLLENQDALAEAVRSDYGHREPLGTRAAEILTAVGALGHAAGQLEQWMQPEVRPLAPESAGPGAHAEIRYQPKGVVGVISPWNAPILLCFSPLAGILAAGNRAMIKPSELAPRTADLLKSIVTRSFDADEIAVFPGDRHVGEAFAQLPFDHLIFTGSAATAKLVMAAAAKNLVPVTLELGGKSPVIIGSDAQLEVAAIRIANGKLLNAGQVCISPDYTLVPEAQVHAFIKALESATRNLYPSMLDNEEYTSLISEQHYSRIQAIVDDARSRGADIIEINPANEDFSSKSRKKLPLRVLSNVGDDMLVMQEELFGPLLAIRPYTNLTDAIAYINRGPRPLAIYYFGHNENEIKQVVENTWSGNVAINDVVAQGFREELPYGGIGASGMGAYRGIDGFRTFSHAKPVFFQTDVEAALAPMRPPYSPEVRGFVDQMLKPAATAAAVHRHPS